MATCRVLGMTARDVCSVGGRAQEELRRRALPVVAHEAAPLRHPAEDPFDYPAVQSMLLCARVHTVFP